MVIRARVHVHSKDECIELHAHAYGVQTHNKSMRVHCRFSSCAWYAAPKLLVRYERHAKHAPAHRKFKPMLKAGAYGSAHTVSYGAHISKVGRCGPHTYASGENDTLLYIADFITQCPACTYHMGMSRSCIYTRQVGARPQTCWLVCRSVDVERICGHGASILACMLMHWKTVEFTSWLVRARTEIYYVSACGVARWNTAMVQVACGSSPCAPRIIVQRHAS